MCSLIITLLQGNNVVSLNYIFGMNHKSYLEFNKFVAIQYSK